MFGSKDILILLSKTLSYILKEEYITNNVDIEEPQQVKHKIKILDNDINNVPTTTKNAINSAYDLLLLCGTNLIPQSCKTK